MAYLCAAAKMWAAGKWRSGSVTVKMGANGDSEENGEGK